MRSNKVTPSTWHHLSAVRCAYVNAIGPQASQPKHSPNDIGAFVKEEIHEVEEKLGKKPESSMRRVLRRCCTPVFLEAFLLTFLAEWGDRSQIATITLAAHDNPIGVTAGASCGHFLCTGAACVGGELLARKISQRTMATAGGLLFFAFAAHQFYVSFAS